MPSLEAVLSADRDFALKEVERLTRILAETERAAEEIRMKNEDLLAEVGRLARALRDAERAREADLKGAKDALAHQLEITSSLERDLQTALKLEGIARVQVP